MATPQGRRLGDHTPEQVSTLEPGTTAFSTLRIDHYATRGVQVTATRAGCKGGQGAEGRRGSRNPSLRRRRQLPYYYGIFAPEYKVLEYRRAKYTGTPSCAYYYCIFVPEYKVPECRRAKYTGTPPWKAAVRVLRYVPNGIYPNTAPCRMYRNATVEIRETNYSYGKPQANQIGQNPDRIARTATVILSVYNRILRIHPCCQGTAGLSDARREDSQYAQCTWPPGCPS